MVVSSLGFSCFVTEFIARLLCACQFDIPDLCADVGCAIDDAADGICVVNADAEHVNPTVICRPISGLGGGILQHGT